MIMNISNIKIKGKTVLAPMAAVNCRAFNLVCKEYGASLIYSQMVDTDDFLEAIKNKDEEKLKNKYLDYGKEENPFALQFISNNNEKLATSYEEAENRNNNFQIVDINLACPLSKELGKKAGAYFLKNTSQIPKLFSKLLSITNKPVTAKIRLGWNAQEINVLETTKILEDIGVDAIAIHCRTKADAYTGNAKLNWHYLKKVKEKIDIPIIGNGDIQIPGHAKAMIEQTNVDAVMVGRATKGNPLLLKQISTLLDSGKNSFIPRKEDHILAWKRFLELYKSKQERQSLSELQDHARWFNKQIKLPKNIFLKRINEDLDVLFD